MIDSFQNKLTFLLKDTKYYIIYLIFRYHDILIYIMILLGKNTSIIYVESKVFISIVSIINNAKNINKHQIH